MEPKGPKPADALVKTPTSGVKMERPEILISLAQVSHDTWRAQAHRYKKIPLEQLQAEPFADDHKRAADTLRELEEKKPATRDEAVALVATSSHNMWVEFQVGLGKSKSELDLNPNDHDRERAEDIVKALEALRVLSFT